MGFAPETYRDAAAERLHLATSLYASGEYAFAIYTAGLAVECILRGYRLTIDPQFDSRHSIPELFRASGLARSIPRRKVEAVGRAVGVVAGIWRNNHRFRSERAMRAFLNDERLYHGIKGDVLKENARRIVNEAGVIVSEGIARWSQ